MLKSISHLLPLTMTVDIRKQTRLPILTASLLKAELYLFFPPSVEISLLFKVPLGHLEIIKAMERFPDED